MTVIAYGVSEPVEHIAKDEDGEILSGLTDLYVRVRRCSDSYYYDWATHAFAASPGTAGHLMTEIGSTGIYRLTHNWPESSYPQAEGDYCVELYQTPGTTCISCKGAASALKIGGMAADTADLRAIITGNESMAATGICTIYYPDAGTEYARYQAQDVNGVAVVPPSGAIARWVKL